MSRKNSNFKNFRYIFGVWVIAFLLVGYAFAGHTDTLAMEGMATIQKHIYEHAKEESEDSNAEWDAMRAIANGTPLPKNHGRLIECEPIYDELIRSYRADEKDYPERGKDYRVGLSNAIDLLIKAPTIIEGSDAE